MRRATCTILFCTLLAGWSTHRARGDTHYCDLSLSANGAGTASDPWQWSQACNVANVSAGDTVYVCGTRATAISLTASNAKGTSGNVITYAAWQDQSPPTVPQLGITGPGDFYLTFDGFTVNPPNTGSGGYKAVLGTAVHHLTFRHFTVNGVWYHPVLSGMTDCCFHFTSSSGDHIGNVSVEDTYMQDALYGFSVAGTVDGQISLKRSTIYHLASAAIQWVPNNNPANLLVEDSTIYHGETEYFYGDGRPGDNTHASAFSLWNDNVTARRCVVHDFGNTTIFRTYPDYVAQGNPPGYSNITIEDCLFYDPINTTTSTCDLNYLAANATITGNTFVGHYRTYPTTPWKAQKYNGALHVGIYTGYDGSNVVMRNNIIIGIFECSNRTGLDEDYNFFYSWCGYGEDGGIYFYQNPLGAHSTIVAYAMSDSRTPPDNRGASGSYNPPFTTEPFGGSGNFFIGGPLFDTYHAQYTQTSGLGNHKQDLTGDYKPVVGNTYLIDAGVSGYGTGYAVDKTARDASPDIGAYEFVSLPPPPSKPANPTPANGATGVALNAALTWDPTTATNSYTVYWDDVNPPVDTFGPQAGVSYTPAGMTASKTYYWKVRANGDAGQYTDSDVWSYTTTSVAQYHVMIRHN
jgi:hypothetical protein